MAKKLTKTDIRAIFNECKSSEDVKSMFVAMFDIVPEGAMFDYLMAQYTAAYDRLSTQHTTAEGKTYTGKSPLTAKGFATLVSCAEMLNVKLYMNGQMLYASGDTKAHAKELKELGFWFSGKNQNWYYKTASGSFANENAINRYATKLADPEPAPKKTATTKAKTTERTKKTAEGTKKAEPKKLTPHEMLLAAIGARA